MNFTNFITKTQNGILSAAMVIAGATAINAVLGFVKGRLLASYFGVSDDLAIFYTADRIPYLVYSILVVGAVSTVFIPVFTDILKKDKEKAFESASSIITATLAIFFMFSVLVFIFANQIITLLTVGKFSQNEIIKGAILMRIMMGAQMLLVMGSLATSILQSFKYFLIPAIAPVLYNIGMISGVVLLSDKYGIYGPTYGVLIGAILNFLIQIPLLNKTGFNYRFSLNFKDKSLREMLRLVPPKIIAVAMTSIVGTINNSLAILISASSVIYLKFATQLQTFPVIFVGLSMASAALPTLSKETDPEDRGRFKETLLTTLHQTMFLVLPISVILLILRIPVVRIVYGVSNFPWEATLKTSYALAFFSLSIFADSGNYVLSRAFYALKDTKTPVLINLFTIVTNVALSIYFVTALKLGVWSIALVYTITSLIDFILYLITINYKVGGFDKRDIIVPFAKISISAVLMGISLYIPLKTLDKYIFNTEYTMQLLLLTGVAGFIGMTVYLIFTKLFNVKEIDLFYKLLGKLRVIKTTLPEPITEPVA